MVLNTIENIKDHPFTFMQLADKEKFHTGLIAYAIKEYPKFLNILINDGRNYNALPYHVLIEHDSTDILIVDGGDYFNKNINTPFAVIEVKFKSAMHSSKKNEEVIPQLSKYEDKYKKYNPQFIYIYLFDEPEVQNQFRNTWKFISYRDLITMLQPSYGQGYEGSVQIVGVWMDYIKLMLEFSKFIKDQALYSLKTAYQSNESIGALIGEIKMRGLVDHYRYSLFLNALLKSEKLQSPLLSYPLKDEEKKKDCIYYKIDNTHGNGLIHFELYNGKTTFGIQWQSSSLKLYVHADSKKNSERDEELIAMAAKLFGEAEHALNKDGVFRSISILKELSWDIYDDQNDKVDIISEYLNKLSKINN
jgi:hypothetical protein